MSAREAITAALPGIENYVKDFDRVGRMLQGAELASDLIQAELDRVAAFIAQIKQERKEEAPDTAAVGDQV